MQIGKIGILVSTFFLVVICFATRGEARDCKRIDSRLSQVNLSPVQWHESQKTWQTIGEGAEKQFQGDAVLLLALD